MKKSNVKLLMAAGVLLCVLLFLERLTGEILHAALGLLLFMIASVHTGKNWKKMKHKKASVQAADWVILIALVVLVLSGICLHPLRGMLALKIAHKLAAVVFVLGMIAHAVQNRKNFSR